MLLKIFCVCLTLASTSFAFPNNRIHASRGVSFESSIREKLAGPPTGWVKDEDVNVDKSSMMSLRIHLVHRDMDKFHEMATNIATPGHELYGQHLSQEVIDSMIAPKDESRDLVFQWLDREGLGDLSSLSLRKESIVVQASISQIEHLLHAEYSVFRRSDSQQNVIRTLEYSLPALLKHHVDMVQPTTFFGFKPQRSTMRVVGSPTLQRVPVDDVNTTDCAITHAGNPVMMTPKCLAKLYNFQSAATYTNGLIGIAGFLEEHAIQRDLDWFVGNYSAASSKIYTCTEVNAGLCPTPGDKTIPTGEASLDVQYARAITGSIPNMFYSTGGRPPTLGLTTAISTNEPYLEFLDFLLNLTMTTLPNTISISYGDDEDTVPLDYATHVCNLFSQLGARGVSILVASGDSGVGGSCLLNGKSQFTTAFPASCPWVTTVGGTSLLDPSKPEEAWNDGGGGFSEVFGRPNYQNSTVNNWLANDKTHSNVIKYFNASGRAYPDVSAQATMLPVFLNGVVSAYQGTSCATPTFASIVQLLNSDRLTSGKSALGFLNPWLYNNTNSSLTDIKSGGNTGCGGTIGPSRAAAGFQAVAGWDPATGLGTPNFEALLKISRDT